MRHSASMRALGALGALLGCAPPAHVTRADAPDRPLVVGYLASWGVRSKGTRIAELPAERLTHLFYAFARLSADGTVVLGDPCLDAGDCAAGRTPPTPGGNFAALRELKSRHPHLAILPSIGGWSGSARFSDAAFTEEARRRFASSAVALFMGRWRGLFDGIDVDWEFPVSGGERGNVERPEDRGNFTLLLAELRRQLDSAGAAHGRRYQLSIAASARPSQVANLEIARITPLLDFIGVMTYDYHTGGRTAHFNAPLFAAPGDPTPHLTTESSIRAFVDAGVPRRKLLIGAPFYGRGYGGVRNVNDGLFQPASPAPPEWRDLDYRALVARRPEANGFVRRWSDVAQVPWLHDPTTGIFISYDDSASMARRGAFIRERGLGGVIVWELGGDDARHTLLRALTEPLRN